MQKKSGSIVLIIAMAVAGIFYMVQARAQDAPSTDPARYKVEFENEYVRVLRITYEPKGQSVMHSHPASVAIFLTDGQGRMTHPDGTTEEMNWDAGSVRWSGAEQHQPENLSDEPFELIQVELKNVGGADGP